MRSYCLYRALQAASIEGFSGQLTPTGLTAVASMLDSSHIAGNKTQDVGSQIHTVRRGSYLVMDDFQAPGLLPLIQDPIHKV
jgi:hypothetical protein